MTFEELKAEANAQGYNLIKRKETAINMNISLKQMLILVYDDVYLILLLMTQLQKQ